MESKLLIIIDKLKEIEDKLKTIENLQNLDWTILQKISAHILIKKQEQKRNYEDDELLDETVLFKS